MVVTRVLISAALPLVALLVVEAQCSYNLRPIIGVLSQTPSDSLLSGLTDKNYSSYIAASYVKYLESAGARVVPILIHQDDAYYDNLLQSVNGFLFPGGGVSITNSSGYGAAGQKIYDYVREANSKEIYLPLWGTCLGFEMLTYLGADQVNLLTSCNANNKADPLTLQDGSLDSRIFTQMPVDILTSARTLNVTINLHSWCITPENFTASGLSDDFKMLATSLDWNGLEYVSLMEHRDLPIFGSQFHPEKNQFEWVVKASHSNIPHTLRSLEVSQYFANFFVEQARQNNQSYTTMEEEETALIYNYDPVYTDSWSPYTQVYFFRDPIVTSQEEEDLVNNSTNNTEHSVHPSGVSVSTTVNPTDNTVNHDPHETHTVEYLVYNQQDNSLHAKEFMTASSHPNKLPEIIKNIIFTRAESYMSDVPL